MRIFIFSVGRKYGRDFKKKRIRFLWGEINEKGQEGSIIHTIHAIK